MRGSGSAGSCSSSKNIMQGVLKWLEQQVAFSIRGHMQVGLGDGQGRAVYTYSDLIRRAHLIPSHPRQHPVLSSAPSTPRPFPSQPSSILHGCGADNRY